MALNPHLITTKLLPAQKVWQRYGISGRTFARWTSDPSVGFPPHVPIGGRRYWYVDALAEWETSRLTSAKVPEAA